MKTIIIIQHQPWKTHPKHAKNISPTPTPLKQRETPSPKRQIWSWSVGSRLAVALICAPFAVRNLDDNVILQYLAACLNRLLMDTLHEYVMLFNSLP